jgi:hypothetical protein
MSRLPTPRTRRTTLGDHGEDRQEGHREALAFDGVADQAEIPGRDPGEGLVDLRRLVAGGLAGLDLGGDADDLTADPAAEGEALAERVASREEAAGEGFADDRHPRGAGGVAGVERAAAPQRDRRPGQTVFASCSSTMTPEGPATRRSPRRAARLTRRAYLLRVMATAYQMV